MADGGVDFGREGSARNVGAFPGRELRCAEERGKWVFLRARVPLARLFPGRTLIVVYLTIIV